jgi:hypothetical protein
LRLQIRLVPDKVHDGIDGQAADELAPLVDDGCRNQVVALERLGGVADMIGRSERHRLSGRRRRDQGRRVGQDERRQRHRAAQHIPAVDHEDAIGLRRQSAEGAKIGEHPLNRVALRDRHPFARHVSTHAGVLVLARLFEHQAIPGLQLARDGVPNVGIE